MFYSLTIEHMIPFSKALSSRKKKRSIDFLKFHFSKIPFYFFSLSSQTFYQFFNFKVYLAVGNHFLMTLSFDNINL